MEPPQIFLAKDPSLLDEIERVEKSVFGRCAYSRRLLAGLISSVNTVVVAARIKEHIIGYAAGECLSKSGGHIVTIGVEESFRGRGVGSRLLEALESELKAKCRTDRVFLEVKKTNRAAVEFYIKRGYRVAGLLKGYYGRDGDGLLMVKRLR